MAPDTGRHDADENAIDRARIDYLAGEVDTELRLSRAERAELDELRDAARRPDPVGRTAGRAGGCGGRRRLRRRQPRSPRSP